MLIADAQCVIPTEDLQADIAFFTKTLRMRMDTIYPADDPKVAVFSGHGIAICIDKDAVGNPANINLLLDSKYINITDILFPSFFLIMTSFTLFLKYCSFTLNAFVNPGEQTVNE